LDDDSDNDGLLDGEEDANHNGVVDGDETDPNVSNRSAAMPWIPLLLLGDWTTVSEQFNYVKRGYYMNPN
jgi:hypothetical protein